MDWSVLGEALLQTWAGRRLAGSLFGARLRHRVRALDQARPGTEQLRLLRGLVHRARRTRFGLDHNFSRVRTLEDYQRLVPLRTLPQLWQEYGAPALPHLEGATWPGPIYYLASCEAEPNRPVIPIAVSSDLVASHRQGLESALALATVNRPQARLLNGSVLVVGGGTALTAVRGHSCDSLEELARRQMPTLMRPFTLVAPQSGHVPLASLAERVAPLSVTCLAGHTSRLLALTRELRDRTGCLSLLDLWPDLAVVLYTRGAGDPDRAALEEALASPRHPAPVFAEAALRPEGVLAVEDPRQRRLRLLPDTGVFYEFVPDDQVNSPRPERFPLAAVEPGVPYALALTSAAGLWACLIGVTVTFERNNPPLLRSLDRAAPSIPLPVILPLPARQAASHPPRVGIPAGPPERLGRSPWSARADQR